MGNRYSASNNHQVSTRFVVIRKILWATSGVLFILGFAALIIGSIATLGGLPVALAATLGISGAIGGFVSAIPVIINFIENVEKDYISNKLQNKMLKSYAKSNEKTIKYLEHKIKVETDINKKRQMEETLNELLNRANRLTRDEGNNISGLAQSITTDVDNALNTDIDISDKRELSRMKSYVNRYIG